MRRRALLCSVAFVTSHRSPLSRKTFFQSSVNHCPAPVLPCAGSKAVAMPLSRPFLSQLSRVSQYSMPEINRQIPPSFARNDSRLMPAPPKPADNVHNPFSRLNHIGVSSSTRVGVARSAFANSKYLSILTTGS